MARKTVKKTVKKAAKKRQGGERMEWLWLAVAGMVFLALSNIALKIIVGKASKAPPSLASLVPVVAVVLLVIAAALAFLVMSGAVSADLAMWAAGFALLSTIAFGGVALALQQGKVAVVTALMSVSTVLVAVISYTLFGDRFTLKEIAAVALAIASVAVLAL